MARATCSTQVRGRGGRPCISLSSSPSPFPLCPMYSSSPSASLSLSTTIFLVTYPYLLPAAYLLEEWRTEVGRVFSGDGWMDGAEAICRRYARALEACAYVCGTWFEEKDGWGRSSEVCGCGGACEARGVESEVDSLGVVFR